MKLTVAFCLLCLIALAIPAHAGYDTTYKGGIMDVSTYCYVGDGTSANFNCWKQMPSLAIKDMALSADGQAFILDQAGCVFAYNIKSQVYTPMSATAPWPCGWKQITVEMNPAIPDNILIGLTASSTACPAGTSMFYWAQTISPSPGSTGICLANLYGSRDDDGSEMQLGRTGTTTSGNLWYNGSYHDMGPGPWIAGDVYNKSTMCAIRQETGGSGRGTGTVNRLYLLNAVTGAFELFNSPSPENTGDQIIGCMVSNDETWVYTALGHARVLANTDPTNFGGTQFWATSAHVGITPCRGTCTPPPGYIGNVQRLAGVTKGSLFGVVNGQLYHYNVLAGMISGQYGGLYYMPGANHNADFAIHMGGVNPNPRDLTSLDSANNLTLRSWDADTQCDPLFGPPNDSRCRGSSTGQVLCSVTVGGFLASPNPPPQGVMLRYSDDWRGWSGEVFEESVVPVPGGGWKSHLVVGTIDLCNRGTAAVCAFKDVSHSHDRVKIPWTQQGALNENLEEKASDPWNILRIYDPDHIDETCFRVAIFKHAKIRGTGGLPINNCF